MVATCQPELHEVDLSHPIAVITTPLTGRVLEVLAGTTRPLSASDIGRLVSEGTRQGVAKVLARLGEQGIVLADRRTSATYYTANRDHLAWPAIEQLATLPTSLRNRLAHDIGGWPVRPVHASIFGSVARGDADPTSDIDVLLVRPERLAAADEDAWEQQLDDLRDGVHRLTGNTAQIFTVTPSRLLEHARAQDPLVTAWRRDAITLVGQPISAVISALRP
jgi:hypothetical protein